jgi:hypothetical protein
MIGGCRSHYEQLCFGAFLLIYHMQGWIKLHRQVEDNPLWLSEKFTKAQAWIDLILFANHKDGTMVIRGNIIKIKRGQTGWSELTMMKRWRWSKNKVRRFLSTLERVQQIKQEKLYKITSITTILNYERYQGDTTDDTTEGLQKDYRRYTNKNDKNVKNDNKNTVIKNSFKKPYIENDKAYKKGNTWYVIVGGEHKEYVGKVKDNLVWK